MNLEIDHLFNHPQHVHTVATWIYNEFWTGRAGFSTEFFEGLLRKADRPDRIPLSLVAIIDGRPAGTVNLIENDDERRPHLRPWLAALVVMPEFRHRGVGTALVRSLLSESSRLGIPELFLGTHIPEYYARLGASIHEQVHETHWVMRFAVR